MKPLQKVTKWSQRVYFYINAAESVRTGRPLCANISYHNNGSGRISVFAFRASTKGGYHARVVQVDKAGNLSFAKSKVKSSDPTGVERAVDKGRRLADASEVLANTTFLEANPKRAHCVRLWKCASIDWRERDRTRILFGNQESRGNACRTTGREKKRSCRVRKRD